MQFTKAEKERLNELIASGKTVYIVTTIMRDEFFRLGQKPLDVLRRRIEKELGLKCYDHSQSMGSYNPARVLLD